MSQISPEILEKLANKTIFFGHQSVGNNILSGLSSLVDECPWLNFEIDIYQGRVGKEKFLHAPVGKNMDPLSKIHCFCDYMDEGVGNNVDYAFFKFCYIDITAETDEKELFQHYKSAMDKLVLKYPNTTFLHSTVPLTVVQAGIKVWVKRVLGRPVGGEADNIKRHRYNEMIRKEYLGKAIVYDLAAIESTYTDGKRNKFHKNGLEYYGLIPEYSSDGRHLNGLGARLSAVGLVETVSRLAR